MLESLTSLSRKLTSPKKVLAFVGIALTVLAFARIAVLVLESYSAVWSERQADRELMRMCDAGSASLSADFRALCLKKRAEQSAPILLKALLRACTTAFTDFCESMSSPTKVVLLILFCLTGVAAPVAKALATLVVDHMRKRRRRRGSKWRDSDDEESDDDETSRQKIVVVTPNDGWGGDGTGCDLGHTAALGMRLRRSVRQMRRNARRITTPGPPRGEAPLVLGRLADEDDVEEVAHW